MKFNKNNISPGDAATISIKGVDFTFCYIPSGSFLMGRSVEGLGNFLSDIFWHGGNDERSFETPQHKVNITKGFWLLEAPVTQLQWQAIMSSNPSECKGDCFPVNNVSWFDCLEYVDKLNEERSLDKDMKFILPTEAQWEYACRAGTTGERYGVLSEIASYSSNSRKLQKVKSKYPNAWGLYDMLGNVFEWVLDAFGEYPKSEVADPCRLGAKDSYVKRVVRGGSCYSHGVECRAVYRDWKLPQEMGSDIGFRIGIEISSNKK